VRFWGGLFLAGVGLNVLDGAQGWPAVFSGHLQDPDSYMRLDRVLQGVRAGHLTNFVRGMGPDGVLVEWSRLFDALLWVMAAPLAPMLGWRAALFWAGVVSGPVLAGLLVLALAFVAEPFVARRFLWFLAPAIVFLPALSNYAAPGVVTQHVLLLVLLAACAGCVARADAARLGWGFLGGAAAGFSVWLTPEAMPYVLLAFGFLLVRWLEKPAGAWVAACGAGFVDVIGFGFAIDPPAGGYGVMETDRLSLVFVALGMAVFCAGVWLWRLERVGKILVRRVAGVAGVVALLGAWLALCPGVALGPYGLMSRAEAREFFGVIEEMRPAGWDAVSFEQLWPGFCGVVIGAGFLAARRNAAWAYGLAGLAAVFGLGVAFLRFAPVSAAAGAVLMVLALQEISARFFSREALAAAGRIFVLVAVLLVPVLPALAHGGGKKAAAAQGGGSCDIAPFAPAMATASGKMVLTDVNDGPEWLWRTKILVVGGLYHHGIAGFLAARADWRAPAEAPAPGVAYVVFCTGAGRSGLVADLPRTTLWDALLAKRPPAWLRPVAADKATGWILYQVAPP